MRSYSTFVALVALALWAEHLVPEVSAAAPPSATSPSPGAASQAAGINDTYPGLPSSGLTFARLADLPKGTVLRAGDLTIAEKDVSDEIAKAPKELQDQLKKNAFFLLEQMATKVLLVKEAKADAVRDAGGNDERALLQGYLGKLVEKVKVSDEEIAEFYKNNKDAVGGADLDKVKPQIAGYLRRQKQQELVAQHVMTLGQRTAVEVSASWAKEQAALAKDNPVDKARASGKPSLVDFGSKGCRPCDMLAPILETLKKKYDGKANVLFVSVVQDQILTARYGINSIPVQVFFDKDGKEVFRHVGFWPQEEIEKQMAKMGVK
jgi:thiol-disulfide isomerase/thioredoxin